MSEGFLSDSLQTKRRCRPSRTRLRSSGPSMRRTKRSSSLSPSRRESNQDRPFPSLGHEHCPRMQGVAKVLNPVLRMGRLGLQGRVSSLGAPPPTSVRSQVAASPLEEIASPLEGLDDAAILDFLMSLSLPTFDAIFPQYQRSLANASEKNAFLSTLDKPPLRIMWSRIRDFFD